MTLAYESLQSSGLSCVICLEGITEKAIALPCHHDNFDFACLGAWVQRQPVCPLCKSAVKGIQYDLESEDGPRFFDLPLLPPPSRSSELLDASENGQERFTSPRLHDSISRCREEQYEGLDRRRKVYRHQLYSLHVGSNRFSRYRNMTPQLFRKDERLIRKAKIWLRRELQVFEFLNFTPSSGYDPTTKHTARNTEFLISYILAILHYIDIRGSAGQAEELLHEFLGQDNAKLLLHELETWLRSPFERLRDWDDAVQYLHMEVL